MTLRFKREDGSDFPDWEEKKLEDITTCLDTLRIPLNEQERSQIKGNIPYCGANGVVDYINKYTIDDSIILLAEDGGHFEEYSTKPIAYQIKGKCWVNNHAHIIKANPNYDQQFIFYSLEHKDIRSFLSGGTRVKLNKSEMLKIKIKIPILEEQEKIANFLSVIDDKLDALKEKEKLLRKLKQGLLEGLFKKTLRFKKEDGSDFPDWEEKKLGDISTVSRGASPRPIADLRWFDVKSTVGWVRISDVTASNMYLVNTTQKLSEAGIRHSRFIPANSLIMSICATVGKPVITTFNTCIHDGFVHLDKLKIDKYFFYHLLIFLQDKWIDSVQIGSQMNLNTMTVSNKKVIIPPILEEQEKIASFLTTIDEELDALKEKENRLRKMKQGLLEGLFNHDLKI